MTTEPAQFRFVGVNFMNAVPLINALTQVCPDADVSCAAPSRLSELLINSKADAALIPVVDLFESPDLVAVGTTGIAAEGPSMSTLLKCLKPIGEVRKVRKDAASSTTNALTSILLEQHFHSSAKMIAADDSSESDAEVVIGDRALVLPPAPGGDHDLSGAWYEMTGLPFVFAVWATRSDHHQKAVLADVLDRARDTGMREIQNISESNSVRLGLDHDFCRRYLAEVMRYKLGDREREGMMLFRESLSRKRIANEC